MKRRIIKALEVRSFGVKAIKKLVKMKVLKGASKEEVIYSSDQ